MSDNDLIRRGDAMAELAKHAKGSTVIGGQNFRTIQLGEATDAIAALEPAPRVNETPKNEHVSADVLAAIR